MDGAIIIPVIPEPDESLHSLLTRAIRLNSYDRLAWLREAVNIPANYSDLWSTVQCDALAALLGRPAEDICRRAYIADARGYTFFDHRLTRKQFEWTRRKVCPHCLDAFGYHSAVFELSAVQVCPLHAVRLRTTCHACGKSLRWSTPSVTRCSNCRADQRRAICEAVPVEQLGGIGTIAKLAGLPQIHPGLDPTRIEVPEGLTHLGLGELQTLIVRLGLFLRSGRSSWQGHALNDPAQAHRIVNEAWITLQDWPENLHRLLHEMSGIHDEGPRYSAGLRRAFHPFYDFVAHREHEPWMTVRAALQHFAQRDWDGLVMPRANAKLPVITSMISEPEVARKLGVAKTRALVGSGAVYAEVIHARQGVGRTSKVFLDRTGLNRLCPGGVVPLDLRATARRLGLSEILTKRLVQHGVLPALSGPPVSDDKRYLFAVSDIDRLIERFEARLPPVSDPSAQSVGFSQLLKAQGELGLSLRDVMSAIVAGDLPPVTRRANASGLAAYGFDARVMRATFHTIAARASGFTEVSRQDLVRELGCRKDTVTWLVANGYLTEVTGFGRQKPLLGSSVEAFKARWIKHGEVANRFETSRMLVTRALRAAGVTATEPASAAITIFFDRAQVDTIDVGRWLNKVALHKRKTART